MSGERGLTLPEVLVAVLLLGLALLPLMQLYPAVMETDLEIEMSTRAGVAAMGKMEEIVHNLRRDINGVSSGSGTCADFAGCRLEWTIATELSSAVQGVGFLKTIAVTACQDKSGDGTCGAGDVTVRYDAKVTSRP